MAYEIVLTDEAKDDLRFLDAHERACVRDAMEVHLRHEPTKTSRSRIKRLRGLIHPQYRLRIDELRAFYEVSELRVIVIAIIPKSKADEWLGEHGIPIEEETRREDNTDDGNSEGLPEVPPSC
jgi:mRNA interferase RelE/StbE